MSIITINTPQNILLEFKLSSVGIRMIAYVIDIILMLCYAYLLYLFIDITNINSSFDTWSYLGLISVLMLPVMFYSLIFEYLFNGQTIGKKIMNIQVVKVDGKSLTLSDSIMRWLFRLIDVWVSTGAIGLSSMLISSDNQRLGDLVSGTTVIDLRHKKQSLVYEVSSIDDSYQITYPQVLLLKDKDVLLIKSQFDKAYKSNNEQIIINKLAQRLKLILSIENTEQNDELLISTVLKDYNHLSAKEN